MRFIFEIPDFQMIRLPILWRFFLKIKKILPCFFKQFSGYTQIFVVVGKDTKKIGKKDVEFL